MIDALGRDFNKKLSELVAAKDVSGLCSLADHQKREQKAVELDPYPQPEDMAESMANDFASDLYKHYKNTASEAQEAAEQLKAEVKGVSLDSS